MNGFANIPACTEAKHYACYTQYYPGQIPNLAALARRFVISDRTFSMNPIASWGAHLELVAAQLDGFTGALPVQNVPAHRPIVTAGGATATATQPGGPSPTAAAQLVPSCVPDFSLDPAALPVRGRLPADAGAVRPHDHGPAGRRPA